MSIISSATETQGQDITKMVPYTFKWEGREISILLPKETEYSRGMIETKTANGVSRRQDLVSAKNGIPVSNNGSISIAIITESQEKRGNKTSTTSITNMIVVSLSVLSEDLQAGAYLAQLGTKVNVLSQKRTLWSIQLQALFPLLRPYIKYLLWTK